MSRIDDELEQAVRDAESKPRAEAGARGSDEARPVVSEPLGSDGESPKRGWGLLAGLGALMTGILVLVFNSGEDAVVYSYQIDELKAQAAELGERGAQADDAGRLADAALLVGDGDDLRVQ